MMRDFLLSRAALPASSRISAESCVRERQHLVGGTRGRPRGAHVFEDGGEVDGSAGADALGVVALAEETVDTADRELKAGLGGPRGRRLLAASLSAGFAARRHLGGRVRISSGAWESDGEPSSLANNADVHITVFLLLLV